MSIPSIKFGKLIINSNHTRTAATVSPAVVEPTPVVKTDRGQTLDAKRRMSDFPVPGSPTNKRCDSARILHPLISFF